MAGEKTMTSLGLLWQLFTTFLIIGLFSYGGGYVMIPLIQREIVTHHGWLTSTQFMDIIGVAEVTPGPISINSATFVGFTVAGVPGSLAATLGVILPSLIAIMTLAYFAVHFAGSPEMAGLFYNIRPVVVVLILMAAIVVGRTAIIDLKSLLVATAVLALLQTKKLSPILILVGAGLLGIVIY
jgi:chromate transporter